MPSEPTYPDAAFIEAIKDHGGQLAATAEIADEVGCSVATARFRLNKMYDTEPQLTDRREAGGTTIWESRDDV